MEQMQDHWTEKRLDRLENRLEERITNLEARHGKRIDGVYSTIYWVMLIVFAGIYVAGLVAVAQS